MKKNHLALCLFVFASSLASAAEWHVSATGSDTNDGSTPARAFQTLQRAHAAVAAGDVVLIGNGIYRGDEAANHLDGSALLSITKSGRADAWITWKARPGHHPELQPRGWAGIQISGSYHIIDGITVMGANDAIVLLQALESAKKPVNDPYYNTNGILVEGRGTAPDQKPHHVIIRNCVVGKMPGGGITMLEADHFTVEDNKVFDNAWFMKYGGSGITTLNNWTFDDAPGYHVVIQRNHVWNNKTLVPWEKIGKLSDGNGILLDVTDQPPAGGGATNPDADAVVKADPNAVDPSKPKRPEWKARALIANNISAFNGGSGIHVFRTAHVDIINNTTYWNGSNVGYPELFPNRSDDIVFLNNIIVPRPGAKVTSTNKDTRIRWDYNLYPVDQNIWKGPNDIVADPQFIDVQRDITKGNFRLAKGSRALSSGTDDLPQARDLAGQPRPQGAGRDRGAFEQ